MALLPPWIQILVAFQLVSMVPFMNSMDPSPPPSPNASQQRNDRRSGKRPMEFDDEDPEMSALIGGLNLNMPHFEDVMHGQQQGLHHVAAAAGPSSSSFNPAAAAIDHPQHSASPFPHHHLPNFHINVGIPQHMEGMGPATAELDENMNLLIEQITEIMASIPETEECQLPAEGANIETNKALDSAFVDRQNVQGGMEESSQGMANLARLSLADFSSAGPASSSNDLQEGVDPAHPHLSLNFWANQMTFSSLNLFVKAILFPGLQPGEPITRLPMLPEMPVLPRGFVKNIEDPDARQSHNESFGNFQAEPKAAKNCINLVHVIEEETGINTMSDKFTGDVLDIAIKYVRYLQRKIIMAMIELMWTQTNPTFSYHEILVWNQWYPQHQLPNTEHLSAIVRHRRQQLHQRRRAQRPAQPAPAPPKRPRREKRAKKGQQHQQIGGGQNGTELARLSCYIVSLRNDIKRIKNDGKELEKFFKTPTEE